MNRLKQHYLSKIVPDFKKEMSLSNDMQVPRLIKIVISRGINAEQGKNSSVLDSMVADIQSIAGQKPVIRKASKSIATFKIREGMPNGIMVTLRKNLMYAFFDKFCSIASPRIRDFQGFNIKSSGGSFTVGIPDQRIFMERQDATAMGLTITIVTSGDAVSGRKLLTMMGFPFAKN